MGLVVLSVLIQVLTVVHVIRHGRNQAWVLAAVMLSRPGCIAYFVIEIAPGLWGGRTAAAARGRVAKALAPERQLRAARDALDLADTPLNHARSQTRWSNSIGPAMPSSATRRRSAAFSRAMSARC